MKRVFVASPLFSEDERYFDGKVVRILENKGFKTFWAYRDAWSDNHQKIFKKISKALDSCDLLVTNLDCPDIDSGTAWEIGYAVSKGKPVIGVRTDLRAHSKRLKVNLMVEKSIHLVESLKGLKKLLVRYK